VSNALRYVPPQYHETLGREFSKELVEYGHIYAFRFMPDFDLKVGLTRVGSLK